MTDSLTATLEHRAVAEYLGFEPDNHHCAAQCPYCQEHHG